jgi:NTP pyrophosphatase (non-canonical NTP hydrolase)
MHLNAIAQRAHAYAKRQGFWNVPFDLSMLSEKSNPFTLSKLMLITTEVAEAAEAVRSGDVAGLAEELADTIIRVGDLAAAVGIDLAGAVEEKMAANEERPYKHGRLS